MKEFILGMLVIQAIFPLIDGITAVLLAGLEAIKGYIGLKITEYNIRIKKLACEEDDPKTNIIEFQYEDQEEEDE